MENNILLYPLASLGGSLSFATRLSRENGWDPQYSLGAIREYLRFMYLIVHTGKRLTPSDEVDQVWHLHMLYTQDYWEEFCPRWIGYPLHHGPTKGGSLEAQTYLQLYQNTLEYYQQSFGEIDPQYWPHPEIRFSRINYMRVDVDSYLIFKKPRFLRWLEKHLL